jgi:hypothetical protein
MVLYNTLIGVTAGMALVLVPVLARRVHRGDAIAPGGWAVTFGVLGVVMTFLSATMVTTWPLTAKPQVNILFGEPTLLLGVLLVAASLFLWRRGEVLESAGTGSPQELRAVLSPVSWVLFALGLILAACTIAIFRFTAIGAAPSQEPVMGRFSEHPGVENTLLGLIYALSAVGTLLAPAAARDFGSVPARLAGWCMAVAGVVLTGYSAMNYYTHIGLEVRTG